ncbi:MAG: O-antigen ligase family protein [Niabella sp.]
MARREKIVLGALFLIALTFGVFATFTQLFFLPIIPVVLLGGYIFLILLFREPLIGFYTIIIYNFLMGIIDREVGGFQYGILNEVLLIITWLSVWYNQKRFDFSILKTSFIGLVVLWFMVSVAELVNPASGSVMGWLQEFRSVALTPMLIAPLGLLLIDTKKKLNVFLILIIGLSALGTLNGIRQATIGLSAGEQRFLDDGASVTHIIHGKLRVFSFYREAAQFGSSQAYFCLVGLVLMFGIKGLFKKIGLLLFSLLSFYGMLISGTRTALFALLVGIFFAIGLSKNFKAVFVGGGIALFFILILKFTYIGSSNYHIHRLRTAMDTEDASLNVRFNSQERLAEYLETRPFGNGLGAIGHWAKEYNSGTYLATIEPDSYWVKIWAMYGIVGFILFFCIWMYLLGRASGLIWNMKDKALRVRLVTLISGVAGLFVASYGNEVMSTMPSLMFANVSLPIVYGMCRRYMKNEDRTIKI